MLLTADVVTEPLRAKDGQIPVRRPEPQPELLARHAASPVLTARWQERLDAVAALV